MADIVRQGVKGWGNMKVALFGQQVNGIAAIKYDFEQEKELVYGSGNAPIDIVPGNHKFSGSLSLYRYELDRIISGLPTGKKITDAATFAITVVAQFEEGGAFQTDVIYAQFTKMGRDIKQNDKMDTVELPLIISAIDFNQ